MVYIGFLGSVDVWSPYTSVVGVTAQGIPKAYQENVSLENMEFLLCRSYQAVWEDSEPALEKRW